MAWMVKAESIMALVPLNQHNKNRSEFYANRDKYPKKNGLECPDCKQELSDRDSSVLCSHPPQKNIICESCGYIGYALR